MRQQGKFVHWNDARGFGFVETETGLRLFVHISALPSRAVRPSIGDPVSFVEQRGRDGRLEASSVSIVHGQLAAAGSRYFKGTRPSIVLPWRGCAAGLIATLLALGWSQGVIPNGMALWYCVISIVSAVLYRADKSRAKLGAWRIAETQLHLADLLGGIAGGLLAQEVFRHKTRKPEFAATTVAIVALHAGVLAALAGSWVTLPAIAQLLG